jgi:hypothetical protein
MDFINFCDVQKILLAVFPPHATHSLQPLDVVLFAPLSSSYSQELEHFIHRSQGLLSIKKGDLFPFFWAVCTSLFKVETIRKSVEVTGIFPMNADIILQRLTNHNSNGASSSSLKSEGYNSTWRDLRKIFDAAVSDTAARSSQKLGRALHSLQVQNELLSHENQGLRTSLEGKNTRKSKDKTLSLQQRKELHRPAMFWSPRKVREANAYGQLKKRDTAEEMLQKIRRKELKTAASLYKKQQLAEAKVERQRLKEVKKQERDAAAAQRNAAKAQKQQERDDANV